MDEIKKYTFDGKFEDKILLVGRTGCGKTTQNPGKNETFGDISSGCQKSLFPKNAKKISVGVLAIKRLF